MLLFLSACFGFCFVFMLFHIFVSFIQFFLSNICELCSGSNICMLFRCLFACYAVHVCFFLYYILIMFLYLTKYLFSLHIKLKTSNKQCVCKFVVSHDMVFVCVVFFFLYFKEGFIKQH
jgi:hypothetical protein